MSSHSDYTSNAAAHDAHARDSHGGTPNLRLIEQLSEYSIQQLAAALDAVLGRVDDALFDFMQNAKQQDSADYIDAMRELRLRRTSIHGQFRAELGDAFAALMHGRAKLAGSKNAPSRAGGGDLSLVSEEDLEVDLAAKQLATALHREFKPVLRQIDQRISWIGGGVELDEDSNPVGPGHVAAALQAAMQGCSLSLHVKLILFKLCERELGSRLEAAYTGINQWLLDRGILPVLPRLNSGYRNPTRAEPEPEPARTRPVAKHPPPRHHADDAAGEAQAAELFRTLHSMLNHYRQANHGPPIAERDAERSLRPTEMIDVLSLLQVDSRSLQQAAMETTGEGLAQRVKAEVLAGAGRLGLDPSQTSLDPVDEDTIDLVGMLFEVLLDERNIIGEARGMVGKLVVPFVKAAMLDRKMFLRKTHPARRFLNILAEACESNPGETPAERALLDKANSMVDRLAQEFNESLAIFDVLLEEMNAYLEQHRKRIELAERRAAEAQQGKERLEQARERVAAEINARLLGRDLPPSTDVLLRNYWGHHLTVVALREGEAGPAYRAALETGEAVIHCFDEANCGVAGFVSTLPSLRKGLEAILASSGCVGESATAIISAVVTELRTLARGDQVPEQPEQTVTASIPQPIQIQIETEPAPEPGLHLVADRDKFEFNPENAEKLRALPLGTWVELIDGDGKPQSIKLAWVSPISSRLMFVNKRGMRVCVASAEELAALMDQGKLSLRSGGPAFERAMTEVLGRLRKAGTTPTSTSTAN